MKVKNAESYKKILIYLAAFIFVFNFSIAIHLFFKESSVLLKEGMKTFILDLILRIGCGMIFDLLAAVPYLISAFLLKFLKNYFLLFIISLIVWFVVIFLTIDAVFFPTGSTDALVILFLPFYATIIIFVSYFLIKTMTKKEIENKRSDINE